ncbi:MAG: Do family serine endopeptidase [Bacteroidetes bacterium]|nr:Do family serine endopeptidase [Bacteroidota bacterium]
MKRILYITFTLVLGITIVYLAASSKKSSVGEDLPLGYHQPEELSVYPASYMTSTPVNGPDFVKAAEKTVDAVVHIRSQFMRKSSVYDDFFGALREYFGYSNTPQYNRSYPISGWGSGVIISPEGYIVTNNHVVQDADLVEVTLNDKRVFEAEIVGTDPSTDLAVIKIDHKDLPYMIYGNSDLVKVGEWVLAVGNPFNLTSTVTAGIVSAKARNINILGTQGGIESFIQTDAAVNRGNSGGALVNTEGQLIGINAAIASNTGSYTGYSFAIPVNIVRKVVDDILLYGEVQRAYIGIIPREIDSDLASESGLKDMKGVYVEDVSENGGADKAGIKKGDVIMRVNGSEVNTLAQLLEIVGQYRPGDKVAVDVRRDNKPLAFNVELRNEDGTTSVVKKDEQFFVEALGATLQRISDDEKRIYRIPGGLKVAGVEEGGMLKSGGIRKGFIIIRVNDQDVSSKASVESAIGSADRTIRIQGVYPNGMRVTYEFGL